MCWLVADCNLDYVAAQVMCSKPYRQGVAEFGCGQCMPCRFNRRRLWTARLMLESYQHESSFFVTLTYSPEHYPSDGSVSVRHLQLFLKRLRTDIAPAKIRYYAVGEYGDRSGRAHYHLVIFGLRDVGAIGRAWRFGMIHVGTVTPQSAGYVASYVCKKMTKEDDARLGGRRPEFARMSLRPGLGAGAVPVIAAAVNTKGGAEYVVSNGDVPGVVRAEGEKWPLGRYLLAKLREAAGYGDGGALPGYDVKMRELQAELSIVGARDAREGKRLQTARRAHVLHSINRSKKGVL